MSALDPGGSSERQQPAKSSNCADAEWEAVAVWRDVGSNLSFTAKLRKRKPLILLEKVEGFWFLARQKWSHGTTMGLALLFGAFIESSITDELTLYRLL